MSYVNPFVYSKHIPTFDHFMDGTLPVRLSSVTNVNFDQFTPDEAMRWIRHYNVCVALERRDADQFKPDYVEYQKLALGSDLDIESYIADTGEKGEFVDLIEYDNFMWELSKSKVGVVSDRKGRVVVHQPQNDEAIDVIMTRVDQVDGQQFIEATVDLENWTGTLKVGESEFAMEYGFNEWQVAQRSLTFPATTESLAQYLGSDVNTNPGILIYEAAGRMFDDVFPANSVVRSGEAEGGQKFRKLFQRTNVQFVKREDVGVIDGQDDLVARAFIELTSPEISKFGKQVALQINLREMPALQLEGADSSSGKRYFVEVVIRRPDTDRYDSRIRVQGQMRNWLSSLWRGEKFYSNLSLEDAFQISSSEPFRIPKAWEPSDSIRQSITIEEIFKKAS